MREQCTARSQKSPEPTRVSGHAKNRSSGAEPFDERLAARRDRRPDVGARLLGDLNRESADSPGTARDEYTLAGAQAQLVPQRVECGERHRRRRWEVQRSWHPRRVVLMDHGVLGEGAAGQTPSDMNEQRRRR